MTAARVRGLARGVRTGWLPQAPRRGATSMSAQRGRRSSTEGPAFALFGLSSAALLFYHQSMREARNDTVAIEQMPTPMKDARQLPPAFIDGLRSIVGAENVALDVESRQEHSKPWSSYHRINAVPDCVVSPKNTQQVSRVVALCSAYRIPIVPYGGATSLEGHILTPARGVTLDMSGMNKILRLNRQDLDCTVQAGLGYLELNERLARDSIFFPLDPGPGASIGGMCACRCSGSTAVKYGTMRDNVLNVTAVLADGTVIRTGTRALKSAAGYDLTRLLIGSEGTLAVITEVTLRLRKKPRYAAAVRVCFPSVRAAAAAANSTLQAGVEVGRCELMDDKMVKIINDANGFEDLEATTLLYELVGPSEPAVLDQVERVKSICKEHGGHEFRIGTDMEETKALWRARKEALWSACAAYPDKEAMITDVCVPLSNLPKLIGETKDEIERSNLAAPLVAHAGDGNFHAFIMVDPNSPEELVEAKRLNEQMVKKALALEGTCTGEHGVGVGKIKYLEEELGVGAVRTMAAIKKTLDPYNIMNPAKVLPTTVDPATGRFHLCV